MDLLAQVIVDGQPIGPMHVGTRSPLDRELPFIHVYRDLSIGGLNPAGWEDQTSLYVATWADTRRDSQAMVREVRRLFGQFRRGGGYQGVWIDEAWESSAPGPSPDPEDDERSVPIGWSFVCRQHWGPDAYSAT